MIQITYNGLSLTDDAGGIMLQPPSDLGTPPIRGNNLVVPFRHGAVWTPKYYGERTIVLNGFVSAPDRPTLWARLDRLKQACSIADQQGPQKLTFAWPDGTTRYLWAEPHNTLGLSGAHLTFTPVSLEFICADPFWHDDAAAQEPVYNLATRPPLQLGDPRLILGSFDSVYEDNLVGPAVVLPVPNGGITLVDDAQVRFTLKVGVTSITIQNSLAATTCTLTGPFLAGQQLLLDCGQYTLTNLSTAHDITPQLTTGLGQRAPLVLLAGPNTVTFTSDAGANVWWARLAMRYSARYL